MSDDRVPALAGLGGQPNLELWLRSGLRAAVIGHTGELPEAVVSATDCALGC